MAKIGILMYIQILWAGPLLFGESQASGNLIEPMVERILELQQVDALSEVNPDEIPLPLLEELGQAVMEEQIGDPDWHSHMNSMMGGEGSAQLQELHVSIGKLYCERSGDLGNWRHSVMRPGMLSVRRGGIAGPPFAGITAFILIAASVILPIIACRRKK
ncbi:MAG: hypothetical protein RQ801_06090 [Spirochaetaceae bacterium]|nr:hypothetical protein [Spirochaetaceae bacterium]